MSTVAQQLMTADEFLRLHGDESGIELVDGQLVRIPMPGAKHGEVCFNVALIFGPFVTMGILFSVINTPIGFSNGLVTHLWVLIAFMSARRLKGVPPLRASATRRQRKWRSF